MIGEAGTSGMMRLWSLRHELSTEWHKYISSDNDNFRAVIRKEYFPYFVQGLDLEITGFQLFSIEGHLIVPIPLAENEISNSEGPLAAGLKLRHTLDLLNDNQIREGEIEISRAILGTEKEVFLLLRYVVS